MAVCGRQRSEHSAGSTGTHRATGLTRAGTHHLPAGPRLHRYSRVSAAASSPPAS